MGCTYEHKQLGFDASPYRTRAHFAPACRVVWERPPYRPQSLGDGSKHHHRKGLKTVCIAGLYTSECLMTLARSIVFPTDRLLIPRRIVTLCRSSEITALTSFMVTAMGRLVGQDPVLRGPALVVAAQILVIKVKVTSVAITSSLVKVTSIKVISQDIRVIKAFKWWPVPCFHHESLQTRSEGS